MNYTAIRKALLRWFEKEQRDLPWRRSHDPYAIWISEIMLQQTRVAAVIPYYERFLRRFPDFHALGAASEEDVLAHWAGLGYYSRARNLQKAARQMVELGAFPREHAAIRELAGVGDYTAGAVASIAFGKAEPIVDGNVVRVLSRLADRRAAATDRAGQSWCWSQAERLVRAARSPGVTNEALMELGATVCKPANPQCANCPFQPECFAYRMALTASLPRPAPKPETRKLHQVLLIPHRNGRFGIRRIPLGEWYAGMWGFVRQPYDSGAPEDVGVLRHTITCHKITLTVRRCDAASQTQDLQWLTLEEIASHSMPPVERKALEMVVKSLDL